MINKISICVVAVILSAFVSTAKASSVCERPITSAIQKVSYVECDKAYEIALIIHRYSKKRKLDWKIIVSMIAQESSFRLNTTNCKKGFAKINEKWVDLKVCHDFGPVQFNYRNIKNMGIDINRLLSDWNYSIDIMTSKLVKLKKKWRSVDPEFWWCRYHSSTLDLKHKYYEKVMKHYDKIERE